MLLVLAPLLLIAAWRLYENKTPGVMTPERKAVYTYAIREERDPNKIKFWADWFQSEGFEQEAKALRNRVQVPTVNGESRARRTDVVRRALNSNNPTAILDVAGEFECRGYGETANMLRDYANGLQWAIVVPECDPRMYAQSHLQTSEFGGTAPETEPKKNAAQ